MRPDVTHIDLAVDTGDGGSCRCCSSSICFTGSVLTTCLPRVCFMRPPLGGRTRLVIIIIIIIIERLYVYQGLMSHLTQYRSFRRWDHSVARQCVHCCKGDVPSQWGMVIFGHLVLLKCHQVEKVSFSRKTSRTLYIGQRYKKNCAVQIQYSMSQVRETAKRCVFSRHFRCRVSVMQQRWRQAVPCLSMHAYNGSVATWLRRGDRFCSIYMHCSFLIVTVYKLLKSVNRNQGCTGFDFLSNPAGAGFIISNPAGAGFGRQPVCYCCKLM